MTVTGSDGSVYPPMSTFLESEGIEIFAGYREENIPAKAGLVVGNAMSRGNAEVEAALDRKLLCTSLPGCCFFHTSACEVFPILENAEILVIFGDC